jgi:hypothetical protein
MRRILSITALLLATLVLTLRIREINQSPEIPQLAPRSLHLLYLDSLRTALLEFAEQYGRPVFRYDTTSPVTGHGRIQLARLRIALFDPRIEYDFSDQGFAIEWRGDPKPRYPRSSFVPIGAPPPPSFGHRTASIANAWPEPAAEYARLRREFITPRWPEPPAGRSRREHDFMTPPRDAFALQAAIVN